MSKEDGEGLNGERFLDHVLCFEKSRVDRGLWGKLVCPKGGVLLLASDLGAVLIYS